MGVSWARTCLIAAGNLLAGTTISIVQVEARTALAAQTGTSQPPTHSFNCRSVVVHIDILFYSHIV